MEFLSFSSTVIAFFFLGVCVALEVQDGCGPLLKDFKAKLANDEAARAQIKQIRAEVEEFAIKFPMPGFDDW